MKRAAATTFVAVVVSLVACGSETTVVGQPPTSGGGAGSGGSAGTASGGAGGGDVDQAPCPTDPPADGDPCGEGSTACEWSNAECTIQGTCSAGQWSLDESIGCQCPVGRPREGTNCDTPGLDCSYAPLEGCSYGVVATCVDDEWLVESLDPTCDFHCPGSEGPDVFSLPCDACCHHSCFGIPSGCYYYWADCVDGQWSVTSTPC